MTAADQVLFVFAHQDDEVAMATRILHEIEQGATVHCAFLTDGALGGASPARRNSESLHALTALGVDPARIVFIGSAAPIPDGSLIDNLSFALEQLEHSFSDAAIARVYCLAWEGGHHDHDASHLVALAFGARRGIVDRCFEMPLYRASRIERVFRVLAPSRSGAPWQTRRLGLREALRTASLVRHYRSQWRSWLGLFPELFAKRVVVRRELFRPADPARCAARPHTGPLLYETRFGCPWPRFEDAARPFVVAHLSLG